jgi:tetratricopeptide (TPR) repeat protein
MKQVPGNRAWIPRRWAIAIVTVLFIAAAPVVSQEVMVDYAEGRVEVQRGSLWETIRIGDSVRARARVRLGAEAYAELSRGRETVHLTRSGTYDLSQLFQTADRNRRVGLAAMLFSRLRRMTTEHADTEPSVAGVRGDEAGSDELIWAGGETPDELIADGRVLLSDGDYEEARLRFEEAHDFAETDAQAARAEFYLAYTDYLEGDAQAALSAFAEVEMTPSAPDYHAYTLTYGQALVETFAYNAAAGLLDAYIDGADPQTDDRQSALVLLGVAYEGNGDVDAARDALRRAHALNPESEQAAVAKELLAGL